MGFPPDIFKSKAACRRWLGWCLRFTLNQVNQNQVNQVNCFSRKGPWVLWSDPRLAGPVPDSQWVWFSGLFWNILELRTLTLPLLQKVLILHHSNCTAKICDADFFFQYSNHLANVQNQWPGLPPEIFSNPCPILNPSMSTCQSASAIFWSRLQPQLEQH